MMFNDYENINLTVNNGTDSIPWEKMCSLFMADCNEFHHNATHFLIAIPMDNWDLFSFCVKKMRNENESKLIVLLLFLHFFFSNFSLWPLFRKDSVWLTFALNKLLYWIQTDLKIKKFSNECTIIVPWNRSISLRLW